MKKALLIGINEYLLKEDILTACLNDVNDFAEFLVGKCDFQYEDIRLLTERRATKIEIMKRLDWLLKGVKAGDRLIFYYSGHGNRLATRNIQGHVDKYYECICPYDFDWEGKNNISDTEFLGLFSRLPRGAKLIWISDSCYSGGLVELEHAQDRQAEPTGKTFRLPTDIAWRVRTAEAKEMKPLKMSGVAENTDIVLISGTKERQQAQERSFKREIKSKGLMTSFLLEELSRKNGLNTPLSEVMKNVAKQVERYAATSKPRFRQEPALHGRPELISRAFLK